MLKKFIFHFIYTFSHDCFCFGNYDYQNFVSRIYSNTVRHNLKFNYNKDDNIVFQDIDGKWNCFECKKISFPLDSTYIKKIQEIIKLSHQEIFVDKSEIETDLRVSPNYASEKEAIKKIVESSINYCHFLSTEKGHELSWYEIIFKIGFDILIGHYWVNGNKRTSLLSIINLLTVSGMYVSYKNKMNTSEHSLYKDRWSQCLIEIVESWNNRWELSKISKKSIKKIEEDCYNRYKKCILKGTFINLNRIRKYEKK
mgnify:CR=1 FL=1